MPIFNGEPDDAPDFRQLGETRSSVARKAHDCAYCRKPILPGTRYERFVCITDGRFEIVRCHTVTARCAWEDE